MCCRPILPHRAPRVHSRFLTHAHRLRFNVASARRRSENASPEAPMTSRKGQLLISSPKLHDPHHFRTVVLLVQHGENSALGLVINRGLETNIKEAWEQVSETECQIDAPIHQGGPCEGPLMLVHTNAAFADLEIAPGLFFTTDRENVEGLVSHHNGSIKFFVNYSGWGPGQLEGEIEAGGWLTAPASADQDR